MNGISNEPHEATAAGCARSHRERGAKHLVVVQDDLTAGTFEQGWLFDATTSLMETVRRKPTFIWMALI